MNGQLSDNVRNGIFAALGVILFLMGWTLRQQTIRFSNAGPKHLIGWQLDNYVHGLANTYAGTQDPNFLLRALCYGQEGDLNADIVAVQARRDSGQIGQGFQGSYDTVLSIVNVNACDGYRAAAGSGSGGTSNNLLGTLLTGLLLLGVIGAAGYLWMNRDSAETEEDDSDDTDEVDELDDPIIPFEEPRPRQATSETRTTATPRPIPTPTPEPRKTVVEPQPKPQPVIDDPTPLGGFQTAYVRGDDAFDKSFIIENGNGDFLGECGVSISESVGTEDGSRNVTAFEIWLFDKNDTHTVTKVVMSENAFEDDATRAKLAPRGEPVLASYDNTVALETNSLIINADVSEIVYSNTMPANGVFERFTVDLSAWVKSESEIRAANAADELDF